MTMTRILGGCALLAAMFATTASAQHDPTPATAWRVDTTLQSNQGLQNQTMVQLKPRVADKKFWALSTMFVGSDVFDVESTFKFVASCSGCREGNPIQRPFIERGRAFTYAFSGAPINAGVMYMSYRMKKSPRWSAVWWVPMTASVAIHVAMGSRNIRLSRSNRR